MAQCTHVPGRPPQARCRRPIESRWTRLGVFGCGLPIPPPPRKPVHKRLLAFSCEVTARRLQVRSQRIERVSSGNVRVQRCAFGICHEPGAL